MTDKNLATVTGVAVTVVALARFVASTHPELSIFLQRTLEGAEKTGLDPGDLDLLRAVIKSVTLIS